MNGELHRTHGRFEGGSRSHSNVIPDTVPIHGVAGYYLRACSQELFSTLLGFESAHPTRW